MTATARATVRAGRYDKCRDNKAGFGAEQARARSRPTLFCGHVPHSFAVLNGTRAALSFLAELFIPYYWPSSVVLCCRDRLCLRSVDSALAFGSPASLAASFAAGPCCTQTPAAISVIPDRCHQICQKRIQNRERRRGGGSTTRIHGSTASSRADRTHTDTNAKPLLQPHVCSE